MSSPSPLPNNQRPTPFPNQTDGVVKTFTNPTFSAKQQWRSSSTGNAPAPVSDDTWLSAHDDPVASLHTTSACVGLADLNNDGDCKLVVADIGDGEKNMKLKVYKGTSLILESTLVDTPTALSTFFMDNNTPHTPAIGIASGAFLFVYKNLRPYFKFTLPPLDLLEEEKQLWAQASEGSLPAAELRVKLERLMHECGAPQLSARSLRFLSLPIADMLDEDSGGDLAAGELEKFVDMTKGGVLRRQSVITCMCLAKKTALDHDAVSCIVLGTECPNIFILDPEAFTIIQHTVLPSAPVCLYASGLYEVDFRLYVVCRDSAVYTLKRGSRTAKRTVALPAPGVCMLRLSKTLVCACMDNTIRVYSSHGKSLWQATMPASITTLESLVYRTQDVSGILIGLENSTVRLYIDHHLISTIKLDSVPTALCFGRFGREENTLVIATRRGGLHVRMVKRDARFQQPKDLAGSILPTSNVSRLVLPKKGKQYVQQALRERENTAAIYSKQQNDLLRLRLAVLRSYASLLRSGMVAVSEHGNDEMLRLRGDVHGFGPQFWLSLELVNLSEKRSCVNLLIGFHYNDRLYAVSPSHVPVPLLVPGIEYKYRIIVECSSEAGQTDIIEVFVFKSGSPRPLVSLDVKMPVSESTIIA